MTLARHPLGHARRAVAICGTATLLLTPAIACDAGDPPPARDRSASAAPPPASQEAPNLRFRVEARAIERSAPGNLGKRERTRARRAMDTVQGLVRDLYIAAYLDPASWRPGSYAEVFDLFAGGARAEARTRARALTAGEDAGERFTAIEPAGATLRLRVLMDRTGAASLVAGSVRFRARALGDAPALFRSEGTYLFRPTREGWRIVSFQVVRDDQEAEG